MLSKTEQKVLSNIDEYELIKFLQKIVQSNSENPPGNEKEVAFIFKEKLESLGCQVQMQEVEKNRFNVIALLEGKSEEQLLFNGHIDTVGIGNRAHWSKDPLGGEIIENKLFGRGSADMKAGLASMVFALEALIKSEVPREKSILLTCVIDEEVYFKGTQALIDENILSNCVCAYISEPTSLGVATSLQGAAEFTAKVYGKSSHAGMAELGNNAIYQMNKIITALEKYNTILQSKGAKLGFPFNPSINVGKISGGTGITSVPDFCEIVFDRQVIPGEDMEVEIKIIEKLFHDVCQDNGIKGELSCDQHFNHWQVPVNHSSVTNLLSCHNKVHRVEPLSMCFRAYCEIEMLQRAGIQGAVYGPGNILCVHKPDEHVDLTEVIDAAKTYSLLAYDFVKSKV